MSPRWDAVLFDLDGTLADTIPLIVVCLRLTLEEHGLADGYGDAELRRTIGRPLRETMLSFASDPQKAEELRLTYRRLQLDRHDEMVRPFDGALDVLDELAATNTPRAIVTSKGREMTDRTMRVCSLDTRFDVSITASDVANPKPDPEPIHAALGALGVAPSRRVLMVGDTAHDVEAGRVTGLTTVAVSWGAGESTSLELARPDHLIDRVADLREIVPG